MTAAIGTAGFFATLGAILIAFAACVDWADAANDTSRAMGGFGIISLILGLAIFGGVIAVRRMA